MAEAIVQFGATYLSGDSNHCWQLHIQQDQRSLYPTAWSVVPKPHPNGCGYFRTTAKVRGM